MKPIPENKKWTLRINAKNKASFNTLKDGSKPIETRAATEKYRRIQKGDILVITCAKERIEKKIKKVKIFRSVNLMAKEIPFKKINPWAKSEKEMKEAYLTYPGYKEKLEEFGVIAFWI